MYRYFLKRFLDIFFSGAGLIILLPVFIIVIFILKFTGEGDVFYIQERIGFNNKPFNIYKFITMRRGSEQVKDPDLYNDLRVFPVGKILRATKINEFPQLFNVFIGTMSFVGPRPLLYEEFKNYPLPVKKNIYHQNKPGITGIGSLFFRHEEIILRRMKKNINQAYEEDILPVKGALELWYTEHKSFWLDFKIVILTIIALFNSKPFFIKYFKKIPKKISDDYLSLIK
jgi:lipopolysaccharide/colanic/teichoic acid biosynthesis glycosyltransferase